MFSETRKQNVLLPDESNTIIFSDTAKQNVLLPDESNTIMFFGHWEAKRFTS